MVETSYYWDGTITGDATLAPISETVFHGIWSKLFLTNNTVQGVLDDFGNELVVAGVAGGVTVGTGVALVEGGFYRNDAVVSISVPTPVTNPRIDRIVLRREWGGQIIRASRLPGAEAASPVAPALTQFSGVVWEISLAQVLITTAGVITVIDERILARTPLKGLGARKEIETIELTAPGQFNFADIPQNFKHLRVDMIARSDEALNASRDVFVRVNNDANPIYNRQDIVALNAVAFAFSSPNDFFFYAGLVPGNLAPAGETGILTVDIANYARTNFYKTLIANFTFPLILGVSSAQTGLKSAIWRGTSAITRLDVFPNGGAYQFASNSRCTLYGIM